VHEQEVRYLMDVEWARSAEDVLWRRTKCGLHGGPRDARRLEQWMAERMARHPQQEHSVAGRAQAQ
jgi:glycerol-3-phosphate dehydrogenase